MISSALYRFLGISAPRFRQVLSFHLAQFLGGRSMASLKSMMTSTRPTYVTEVTEDETDMGQDRHLLNAEWDSSARIVPAAKR